MSSRIRSLFTLTLFALGLGMMGECEPPPAPPLDFVVAVSGTSPDGPSYETLAADWLDWFNSVPANVHPVLDTTGENAAEGQSGAVWFLAGVSSANPLDEPITRTVEVPGGTALFFPIINSWFFCDQPPGDVCDAEAADAAPQITAQLDTAFALAATIDGIEIPNLLSDFRVATEPFLTTFAEDNLSQHEPGPSTAVMEGFFLLLDPLPAGNHEIHFEGALGENPEDPDFTLSVTYNLTVLE